MNSTEKKFIKSAKKWIIDIDKKIDELKSRREEIVEELQRTCDHPKIKDLTKTHGSSVDDGYGKWWHRPYFECDQCKAVDEGYTDRLKHERKERIC